MINSSWKITRKTRDNRCCEAKKPAGCRSFILTLFLALTFVVSGCGKDSKLDEYHSSMEEYYDEVSSYNDAINNIDPNADDAGDQLLLQLDGLNDATQKMAALEVPSQFSSIEDLADSAADNMNQAVTLYHQAYSSQPYDPDLADEGRQYYERANKRIVYILKILHGEIPDDSTEAETAETAIESSIITATESSATDTLAADGTDAGTATDAGTGLPWS